MYSEVCFFHLHHPLCTGNLPYPGGLVPGDVHNLEIVCNLESYNYYMEVYLFDSKYTVYCDVVDLDFLLALMPLELALED